MKCNIYACWVHRVHYTWLMHGPRRDKQCSSLYAVDFMFLAFPDGVENSQNVNFPKFRNVTITYVGYTGVIICG